MPNAVLRLATANRVIAQTMMLEDEIREKLTGAFPNAAVDAADSTGAGDHFAVTVVSPSSRPRVSSSATRWCTARSRP